MRYGVGSVVYFSAGAVAELGIDPVGRIPDRDGPWVCTERGSLVSKWVPLTTRGKAGKDDLEKTGIAPIPGSAWVRPAHGKLYRSAVIRDASITVANDDVETLAEGVDAGFRVRPELGTWYLRELDLV